MAYRKSGRRAARPARSRNRARPARLYSGAGRRASRGRGGASGVLRLVIEHKQSPSLGFAPQHLGPGGGLMPVAAAPASGKAKF